MGSKSNFRVGRLYELFHEIIEHCDEILTDEADTLSFFDKKFFEKVKETSEKNIKAVSPMRV